MADRIPSATAEGDDQRLPANAEDRKAAAALSSLNDNEISQDGDAGSNNKLSSAAAQEALGKAMSRLEIASGKAAGKAGTNKTAAAAASETAKKKAVKIVAEDVTLLVEELDLTKNKATELLRSHDGDAKEAIRAFLTPTIAT